MVPPERVEARPYGDEDGQGARGRPCKRRGVPMPRHWRIASLKKLKPPVPATVVFRNVRPQAHRGQVYHRLVAGVPFVRDDFLQCPARVGRRDARLPPVRPP